MLNVADFSVVTINERMAIDSSMYFKRVLFDRLPKSRIDAIFVTNPNEVPLILLLIQNRELDFITLGLSQQPTWRASAPRRALVSCSVGQLFPKGEVCWWYETPG